MLLDFVMVVKFMSYIAVLDIYPNAALHSYFFFSLAILNFNFNLLHLH